jgi:hypothetical protein
MAERGANLNVKDLEGLTPLDYALGHLPARLARGKTPPADVTDAAAALRELGALGKDEQRTAAR